MLYRSLTITISSGASGLLATAASLHAQAEVGVEQGPVALSASRGLVLEQH